MAFFTDRNRAFCPARRSLASRAWAGVLLTGAALSLAACGASDSGGGSGGGEKDKTITIGTLSWEESLAVTAVWKNMLEDKG